VSLKALLIYYTVINSASDSLLFAINLHQGKKKFGRWDPWKGLSIFISGKRIETSDGVSYNLSIAHINDHYILI